MPLFQLPQLITQLVNARVAMNRLQEFLSAPQQPPRRVQPPAEPGVLVPLVSRHDRSQFWARKISPIP